jgi:AAA family ATP:ADP antiporter
MSGASDTGSPRIASACGLYFFLVMASYYVLKPIRESYFLEQQGFENLPMAHLVVLLVTLLSFQLYAFLARRLPVPRFVLLTNASFVVFILLFWVALGPLAPGPAARKALAAVYFCWVNLFSTFVVTLFWAITHNQFTPAQGGLYHGRISATGILGAMVGGLLTRLLAGPVGTVDLLLLSALLLAPCILLGSWLASRGQAAAVARGGAGEGPAIRRSAWELLLASPYLAGIGLLVFLTIFMSAIDDYRCFQIIQTSLPDLNARTGFYGSLYFSLNLLGLAVGTLVTGPVQRRWGPLPGLAVYPATFLVGAVFLFFRPTVDVVYYAMVAHMATSYSIYQSSKELLFVPTSVEVKYVAKGFIDTFLFRLGGGAGALFILFCWPAHGLTHASFAVIVLSATCIAVAVRLARSFGELTGAGRCKVAPVSNRTG